MSRDHRLGLSIVLYGKVQMCSNIVAETRSNTRCKNQLLCKYIFRVYTIYEEYLSQPQETLT